jgi:hypothetical protein
LPRTTVTHPWRGYDGFSTLKESPLKVTTATGRWCFASDRLPFVCERVDAGDRWALSALLSGGGPQRINSAMSRNLPMHRER